MNIYHNGGALGDSSVDSAVSSAESSRRNSNPLGEFRDYVKRRRQTTAARIGGVRMSRLSSSEGDHRNRKESMDSQFYDMEDSDCDDPMADTGLLHRRFSVPEKVLLSANSSSEGAVVHRRKASIAGFDKDYAILRQCRERKYEIVAAFNRSTEPFRHYMQSLVSYDLAPVNGIVVIMDASISVYKAVTALNENDYRGALVSNVDNNGGMTMMTTTDCLRILSIAASEDAEIGAKTMRHFVQTFNGRKKIVSASVNLGVWDLARLFCLNHVHSIPVLQSDETFRNSDVLCLLSLRSVFQDTIVKLLESRCSLTPHLKQKTLQERALGTWDHIVTVSHNASCKEAIDVFLEKKFSCLPVVDENRHLVGVLSKRDVMREAAKHPKNYLDVLNIPVREIVSERSLTTVASPTATIYEAILLLMRSERQCVFVGDVDRRVVGAVAFFDVMEFILHSAEVSSPRHKLSVV
uniref:CBS domain-containing protein n=1 Tax=Steinernema glaseri TaxID=37863 RepID=A0A1I7Z7K1_9BILA